MNWGSGVWMNFICKGINCGKVCKTKMVPGKVKTYRCKACGATYDVSSLDRLASTLKMKGSSYA